MGIEQYCVALVDAVHRPSLVDDIWSGGAPEHAAASVTEPAIADVLAKATQLSENQQWAELCSIAEKFLADAPQLAELTSLKLLYARALVHTGRSEEAGITSCGCGGKQWRRRCRLCGVGFCPGMLPALRRRCCFRLRPVLRRPRGGAAASSPVGPVGVGVYGYRVAESGLCTPGMRRGPDASWGRASDPDTLGMAFMG